MVSSFAYLVHSVASVRFYRLLAHVIIVSKSNSHQRALQYLHSYWPHRLPFVFLWICAEVAAAAGATDGAIVVSIAVPVTSAPGTRGNTDSYFVDSCLKFSWADGIIAFSNFVSLSGWRLILRFNFAEWASMVAIIRRPLPLLLPFDSSRGRTASATQRLVKH